MAIFCNFREKKGNFLAMFEKKMAIFWQLKWQFSGGSDCYNIYGCDNYQLQPTDGVHWLANQRRDTHDTREADMVRMWNMRSNPGLIIITAGLDTQEVTSPWPLALPAVTSPWRLTPDPADWCLWRHTQLSRHHSLRLSKARTIIYTPERTVGPDRLRAQKNPRVLFINKG